jgi:hypothetical protein
MVGILPPELEVLAMHIHSEDLFHEKINLLRAMSKKGTSSEEEAYKKLFRLLSKIGADISITMIMKEGAIPGSKQVPYLCHLHIVMCIFDRIADGQELPKTVDGLLDWVIHKTQTDLDQIDTSGLARSIENQQKLEKIANLIADTKISEAMKLARDAGLGGVFKKH